MAIPSASTVSLLTATAFASILGFLACLIPFSGCAASYHGFSNGVACKAHRLDTIKNLRKREFQEIHVSLDNVIYAPALANNWTYTHLVNHCDGFCLPSVKRDTTDRGSNAPTAQDERQIDQGCVKACRIVVDDCNCDVYKRLSCYVQPSGQTECLQSKELANSASVLKRGDASSVLDARCYDACALQLIGF